MKERIENLIQDMESHIKWEQKFINRYAEDIKEYTQTSTPENIAMFLPGKIRELQEAIDRKKKYAEQLEMLLFIQREN